MAIYWIDIDMSFDIKNIFVVLKIIVKDVNEYVEWSKHNLLISHQHRDAMWFEIHVLVLKRTGTELIRFIIVNIIIVDTLAMLCLIGNIFS